jgi:hypothetical protein
MYIFLLLLVIGSLLLVIVLINELNLTECILYQGRAASFFPLIFLSGCE